MMEKGANPGDLPIETAEKYFDLNLKTAVAIGLHIGECILRLAHRIVRPEQEKIPSTPLP
jgi:hypothetical protein